MNCLLQPYKSLQDAHADSEHAAINTPEVARLPVSTQVCTKDRFAASTYR
jgi:hypothetical protein